MNTIPPPRSKGISDLHRTIPLEKKEVTPIEEVACDAIGEACKNKESQLHNHSISTLSFGLPEQLDLSVVEEKFADVCRSVGMPNLMEDSSNIGIDAILFSHMAEMINAFLECNGFEGICSECAKIVGEEVTVFSTEAGLTVVGSEEDFKLFQESHSELQNNVLFISKEKEEQVFSSAKEIVEQIIEKSIQELENPEEPEESEESLESTEESEELFEEEDLSDGEGESSQVVKEVSSVSALRKVSTSSFSEKFLARLISTLGTKILQQGRKDRKAIEERGRERKDEIKRQEERSQRLRERINADSTKHRDAIGRIQKESVQSSRGGQVEIEEWGTYQKDKESGRPTGAPTHRSSAR